jgi:transposase
LGEDANPYRHQVVEIPPINPIIVEHRLHQLMCQGCGTLTRATLPIEVDPSSYGVRVVAMVGVLSGLYRHSTLDGAKCHARFIWNFYVLGHSQ